MAKMGNIQNEKIAPQLPNVKMEKTDGERPKWKMA